MDKYNAQELNKLLNSVYKNSVEEDISDTYSYLLDFLDTLDKQNVKKNSKLTKWNSSTSVLITYGDSVFGNSEPSLRTLDRILDKGFEYLSSVLHILPFLPSSSDGGFAVSDYTAINPSLGNWNDLEELSKKHILMADLVINHVSSSHPWVIDFININKPGMTYILSPNDMSGWSNVVRPRNSSLFTPLRTSEGIKNVWTTFGPDQVDLDWSKPLLLKEFLDVIIRYYKHGVGWFRLDAVAFIWKEKGSSCLHRKEAHDIVKILKIILENLSNKNVLITETNVPEEENLSYLVDGNEADLAYNFSLPPLLLECLLSSNADLINKWLFNYPSFPTGSSLLNFSASHDGIGLRGLEGLMDDQRLHSLLVSSEERGGLVSHRKLPNGQERPYELNISWWSAMGSSSLNPDGYQQERFILSQLLVMAIKGVPAFYLPALLASENDFNAYYLTGQRRDLNREKFNLEKVLEMLEDQSSFASTNLRILNKAMEIRGKTVEFHPDSPMKSLSESSNNIVVIQRGSAPSEVLTIHNMTSSVQKFEPSIQSSQRRKIKPFMYYDLLSDKKYTEYIIELKPYEVLWLKSI